MTESAALPPTHDHNAPDLHHVLLSFETTEWSNPPTHGSNGNLSIEELDKKKMNDEMYRRFHTATDWNRYTTLGYFAVDDGDEFDIEWRAQSVDPLRLHRLIWYNYLYHIDRDMDVPQKLDTWAIQVSRPYILENHIKSLTMNTLQCAWNDLKFDEEDEIMTTENEEDNNDTELGWNQVPLTRGQQRLQAKLAAKLLLAESNTTGLHPTPNPAKPINQPNLDLHDHGPPCTQPPVTPSPQKDQDSHQGTLFSREPTIATETRAGPPHPNIAVNDGTHRITLRWEPPDAVATYESDKSILNAALCNVLKVLFRSTDGSLYRWESEDMLQVGDIQNMTPEQIRDFISPLITFISSKSLIVFGIRFGFTNNPIQWQTNPDIKAALKAQHIKIKVSNCKSTGGEPVIAGYILLKAPNVTHRHRYNQYLQSKLPDATPHFDIDRFSKSPLDETCPHLAITCGDKHVTPVCQALTKLLTGNGNALFLPRYAFSTMTNEQVQKQFQFHDTWAKALVQIPMTPMVNHLDYARTEYFDDGTIVTRSAREWAASLCLADQVTPALCDVANGDTDRKAVLLSPRHYQQEARKEWKKYKARLYPPSHRETRFRDAIPDLPDEIHITMEVQSNLSFMEQMSAADIWSKAPQNVRTTGSHNATAPPTGLRPNDTTGIRPTETIPPQPAHGQSKSKKKTRATEAARANKQRKSHEEATQLDFPPLPGLKKHSTSATDGVPVINTPDQSVASTQSLTNTTRGTFYDKLEAFKQIMNVRQHDHDQQTQQASERLNNIENSITRLESMDTRLTEVSASLERSAATQAGLAKTQSSFAKKLAEMQVNTTEHMEEMGVTLLTTLESHNALLTSNMSELQKQLTQMSNLMTGLTNRLVASETPRSPLKRKQRNNANNDNTQDSLSSHMEVDSEEEDERSDEDSATTPQNLLSVFDDHTQDTQETMQQATSTPASPPISSSPPPHSPRAATTTPLPQSPPAPPNPQYTNHTDSAGAPDA